MTLTLTTALRTSIAELVRLAADAGSGAGKLEIRSGTRPANPSDAATGTLLATVVLADPSFGSASSGSSTIADPGSVNAVATGTATWFRVLTSADAACFDGKVTGTGDGGDLTLASTSIVSGAGVDITGGTISMPQGSTA